MKLFAQSFTDPLSIFAVLLSAALLFPLILKPLRIPGVVSLILGGIIIGPEVLGLLDLGAIPELFGKIGILYIMFQAGLEIDLQQLFRRRGETLKFGLLTLLIPLAAGLFGGWYFFNMSFQAALLLGSLFASHTLLTYPEVSRFGLMRNKAVTVAVGGTMVANFPALLILAVIAALNSGQAGLWFWLRLAGLILAYSLLVFGLVPFLLRRIFRNLVSKDDAQFILVFTLLFVMAALAVPAGLEPVIGVFMLGLALNSLIPDSSIVMDRLKFTGNTIFIPLFLVYVGLLVHPGNFFQDPAAWSFAAFMVLVALLSKLIPALLTAPLLHFTWREAFLIYGLTVNQAAATLAGVLVGRQLGLFGDSVLTATVLMILVTCLGGSLITDLAARKVKLQEARDQELPPEGSKRILLSLANPETAPALTELAAILAKTGETEVIFPTIIVQEGPQSEKRLAQAEALLASVNSRLGLHKLPAVPITGIDINVANGLLRVSRARRASLVILGWNGNYNIGRKLFGSIFDQVVHQNSRRLLLAKLENGFSGIRMFFVILPPLLSRLEDFQSSLRTLLGFAQALGVKVCIIKTGHEQEEEALFQSYSKKQALELKTLDQWDELSSYLHQEVSVQDLICLLSARKQQLAWQPSLDRLPKFLAQEFPQNRLMVLYPSIQRSNLQETELEGASDFGLRLGAARIPSQLEGEYNLDDQSEHSYVPRQSDPLVETSLDIRNQIFKLDSALGMQAGALYMLTEFLDSSTAEELMRDMEKAGASCCVELQEGSLLYHFHLDTLEDFQVGIGHYDPPLVQTGEAPLSRLYVLLSPKQLGAEAHLKTLSKLARWVLSKE